MVYIRIHSLCCTALRVLNEWMNEWTALWVLFEWMNESMNKCVISCIQIIVAYRIVSLKPTLFVPIKYLRIHLFLPSTAWLSSDSLLAALISYTLSLDDFIVSHGFKFCLGLSHTCLSIWISFRLIFRIAQVTLPAECLRDISNSWWSKLIFDSSPINAPWIWKSSIPTELSLSQLMSPSPTQWAKSKTWESSLSPNAFTLSVPSHDLVNS